MNSWIWLVVSLLLLIESCVATMLLVPASIAMARRWGAVAQPGDRHVHREPTPALGGMAIVGGFLAVVLGNVALAMLLFPLVKGWFPEEVGRYLPNIPSKFKELGAVLGGALGIWCLGLVDDRRPLGPRLKLGVMAALTLPLLWAGVRVEGFLPWSWMGAVLTVLWVVFMTNSFNFLDNMDGLCAGVALIAALAFGLIAFFAGQWFMTVIFFVLAGSLLGFLRHNFSPARLFMGDNGSLFIGYTLGALSILTTYYQEGVPTVWPVVTPLIVLGVPIFDTLSVLWIRWRSGKPLMQGDKNHLSHRLTDLGMSPRRAVTFIYILTAAIALGATPLRSVGPVGATAILGQTALLFWIIYRLERAAKRRNDRPRSR